MAIAGAVIGASFSTSSASGLRYASQSEHHLAFPDLRIIGSNGVRNMMSTRTAAVVRRLPVLSLTSSRSDSFFVAAGVRQRALRRITAAVAQEEAVETAAAEETAAEETATEETATAESAVEEVVEEVEAADKEEETIEAAAKEEEVGEETEQVGEEGELVGDVGAEEGQLTNTKLYFGNLPYHCDSAQLAGIVQQYGNPELVEVLYNRETGKSRGFGFVTMSTIEDANAVIENLDGSEFAGRHLRVNLADKPRPKEPLYPETEYKLFVGNLSWSATSDSLYQIFQQCGEVIGARVLYDGETGRSRGYGFVCYGTRSEMENALATLNGAELEGRPIRVSMAQGKR